MSLQEEPKVNLVTLKRFMREDDGMEMVEWAIVGIVFAVAAAAFWDTLAAAVGGALNRIDAELG